ncbi:hypothetical protein B0H15DRAFT_846814 [Mycena belliarum]|uniref:Uncharacterized protein n=1 Tax=Mycena belliarum TaxID=1033014 RepID=A0AAD6U349_9AGAR|nr:hypothetical protein B0H15DRAFT_846814 [Mycena belliae]
MVCAGLRLRGYASGAPGRLESRCESPAPPTGGSGSSRGLGVGAAERAERYVSLPDSVPPRIRTRYSIPQLVTASTSRRRTATAPARRPKTKRRPPSFHCTCRLSRRGSFPWVRRPAYPPAELPCIGRLSSSGRRHFGPPFPFAFRLPSSVFRLSESSPSTFHLPPSTFHLCDGDAAVSNSHPGHGHGQGSTKSPGSGSEPQTEKSFKERGRVRARPRIALQ